MNECINEERIHATTVAAISSTLFTIASLGVLIWTCILIDKVGSALGPTVHLGCRHICTAIVLSFLFPGPGTMIAVVLLLYASRSLKTLDDKFI